ncbi:protein translocase subunit SecD [Streptomyces violaceorubidus]
MGAVLILASLAVLADDSLTDFALALLIGVAVGTYSSVFTASPLAIELHNRGTGSRPGRRAGAKGQGTGQTGPPGKQSPASRTERQEVP